MALTEREIALRISATTAGGDKIRELADEVDKLAAEGGAAAPEFKKLADELKKLEQQQGAITQFSELTRKATETKEAFEDAAAATRKAVTAVEDRRAALTAAATAEQQSTASVQRYRDQLEQARLGLATLKAELAQYKAETSAAGKVTDEQARAIANIKTLMAQYGASIASAKASIAAATPEQREHTAAVNTANTSLKQATTELGRNQAATAAARTEYERTVASINKVGDQMDRLGVSSRNLAQSQQQVEQGFAKAGREVEQLRDKAGKAGTGFQALTNMARGAAGQITALVGAVAGLTEFVRVNVELENVNRTLRVLTGSSEAATAEMDRIKEVSNRLGLELIDTAKSYAQFAAATKGTALEGEQARVIFESVSNAMVVAGKSSADTASALNALGQMVSKGTVSMEELRGQLGDRLPGALKLAADGLGLTTSQLVKMVEDGKILAIDLLPKLAVALDNTYKSGSKAGSTLQQDWNRFKNAISETSEELGKSGIITSLLELGKVVATVGAGFGNFISIVGTGIGSTFGAVFATISDLGTALANFDFSGFEAKARAHAQVLRDTWSAELDRAAISIRRFSDNSAILQWALDKVGLGAADAGKAVGGAATAAVKAGQAVADSGLSWAKLTSIYGELVTESEKAIATAEKSVVARRAEGEAVTTLAGAFGTEIDQRKAATTAAQANQAALEEVARQRTAALSVMESELIAMKEWVAAHKDESKERQDSIKKLEQQIAARKEETSKAIAQAQASRLLAEYAKVEQATHADNSARLGELRTAYERTTAELDRLRRSKVEMKAPSEELIRVELEAAKAAAMYRDALVDQKSALQAAGSLKQAQFSLQETNIRLQLEEVNGALDIARAKGDEGEARRLLIEKRRIEIELAKLQAEVLRAEALVQLELVKVQREELVSRGELTKAKELELQRDELLARAKIRQADLTDVTVRKLEDLKRIQEGVNTSTFEYSRLSDQATDSTRRLSEQADGLGSNLGRAAEQAERLAEGVRKVGESYINKDKFVSDKNGNALAFKAPDPWQDHNGNWFYTDASGQLRRSPTGQPVMDKNGNWSAPGSSSSLNGGNTNGTAQMGASSQPAVATSGVKSQAQAQTQAGSTTHTVNITIGGREVQIGTASAGDAQRLTNTLEQLGQDMKRSY